MVFIETHLGDNKYQANDICFPGKKMKKEYQKRKSDDEVQLVWH